LGGARPDPRAIPHRRRRAGHRRSDLAKLAAELPLEDVARRLTEELVAFLRTPANTTTPDWPTVEAKVADLIEVLES
jgi:hypothetical protein